MVLTPAALSEADFPQDISPEIISIMTDDVEEKDVDVKGEVSAGETQTTKVDDQMMQTTDYTGIHPWNEPARLKSSHRIREKLNRGRLTIAN